MKGLHLYKASAGSGKTYTLALYYLSLILDGRQDGYREVLAMTFTNKAAGEMKSRILEFLHLLGQSEDNEKRRELIRNLNKLTGKDMSRIGENAQIVLHHLLHNYSDFHILTLDKFVQNIIRSFARELEFSPQFNIEPDSDYVFRQVIDELLERIGKNDDLERIFFGYSLFKTESGNSYKIENEILTAGRHLIKETSETYINDLRNYNLNDFVNEIDRMRSEHQKNIEVLKQNYRDFTALLDACGIEINELDRLFEKIGKSIDPENNKTSVLLTSKQLETLDSGRIYPKRVGEVAGARIDNIRDQLVRHALEAEKGVKRYFYLKQYIGALYSTAVIAEFEKVLDTFKQEQEILFFIDFNRISTEIIANEPVPFIYERIGVRYKHILLDEFQDNSVRQWQNLLPLLVEALSKGGLGLIVGDEKQAIYRWRNGNAEQFTKLPEVDLPETYDVREYDLSRHLEKNITLPTNYRSGKTIVDFNNAFFESYYRQLPSGFSGFSDVKQVAVSETAGYVSVEKGADTDFAEFNADRSLAIIHDLTSRGYAYKDICILVNTHSHGAVIADHLMIRNQIPVISAESLRIDKSASVQLILNYLHHLINPSENIHKMAILKYFAQARKVDYNTLVGRYTETEHKTVRVNLSRFLHENTARGSASHLSINGLVLNLIRRFGLDETQMHLQFFLNKIAEYEETDVHSLSSFLEWWENNRSRLNLAVPEDNDAVRIMTIHASKGLEFPAVIVTYLDWIQRVKGEDWIRDKNAEIGSVLIANTKTLRETEHSDVYDLEESRVVIDQANLLYVAFTRPVNELYLLCGKGIGKTIFELSGELYKGGTDRIEIGEKTTLSDKTDAVVSERIKTEPAYTNQISFSVEAPAHWSPGDLENERSYGTIFHQLVSDYQDGQSPQDLVNATIFGKNSELTDRLVKHLTALLNHPEIRIFFTEKFRSYPETELMDENGNILRPDRIVTNAEKACVLEFKTGIPKPEHEQQVQEYGRVLKLLGEKTVELYLIYTDNQTVIKSHV